MLDLKQCDLVYPPYLNTQIIDTSYSEEDVQSPHNLIESDHKLHHSMANNEQYAKFKHRAQFYSKYQC